MTKDIKSLVWIGLITIALYAAGFGVSCVCRSNGLMIEGITLGLVGMFTFFGTIFLVTDRHNFASNCFDDGEYRKAITASVFIMFFGMVGFGIQQQTGEGFHISDAIFGDFTFLVELIAGFYFGSRTVETVMNTIKLPGSAPKASQLEAASPLKFPVYWPAAAQSSASEDSPVAVAQG